MCMKLSKNKREKDFRGIGTVGLAARVGIPLVLLPADCFEGSWEETTLSQLAPASWALLIIAKLSPACTSASFSRLRDPGEWVGLHPSRSLDLVPSLTPIRIIELLLNKELQEPIISHHPTPQTAIPFAARMS